MLRDIKGGEQPPAPDLFKCPECSGRGWIYIGTTLDRTRCYCCRGTGWVEDSAAWPVWLALLIFIGLAIFIFHITGGA